MSHATLPRRRFSILPALRRIALPALALAAVGCMSPPRAITYASFRSGCKADKIKVITHDNLETTLDVCGVHEDWKFHAINGWEYVGPSANQPVKAPKIVDSDRDGIQDASDACPNQPGVASPEAGRNGCPPPVDSDGDKIVDGKDACPKQAGVANADPKKNGCPVVDTDGDSFPDDKDACPKIAGIASTNPAENGCPGDTDGDGIRDDKDACPKEAGKANRRKSLNGCPTGKIVFTAKKIEINDKIHFTKGLARIKKDSGPLLDKIAEALKTHTEVKKLEIQGHTDNDGKAKLNKSLSERRAKAVRRALIARGIEKERLVAKGYGPDKPVESNDTDEGKAANRRVEFQILEQAKKKPVSAAAPKLPSAPGKPAAPEKK